MPSRSASLIKKQGGTLLLTTPTFLRPLLKRCEKEDLATLDVVVCGAEKLPTDLAEAFRGEIRRAARRRLRHDGTFAARLRQRAAESLASTISRTTAKKAPSAARLPGVTAKVTDRETGDELKAGEPGMLLDQRPQRDEGLSASRRNDGREVIRDGWYNTGDIAFIDDEGFILITGRESRFTKIGGEMVPHIKIEELLSQQLAGGEDAALQVAVTAVPDEKKGERLIVLHTKLEKSPDELRKGLTEAGLPNLFIPSTDSFLEVDAIPVLGTGKLDLKGIRTLAQERVSQRSRFNVPGSKSLSAANCLLSPECYSPCPLPQPLSPASLSCCS